MGDDRITPGDPGELARCFTAHAPGLFGQACVLVRGDREWAEDLVQATFEATWGSWPTLRDLAEERLRGWLAGTLADLAASSFRRQAALGDRLPTIEACYRETPADPPEQAFPAIALERCWRIIQEMPELQYAVALLRWRLGMKEAEIAALLGVTPKRVRVQLHRARRKLIAQLGPEGAAP